MKMNRAIGLAAIFGLMPAFALAQGFGGPDAVENTIANDRSLDEELFRIDSLEDWFAFKDRLAKESGFSFGADYSAQGFLATDSAGDDSAAGGIARLFGSWELINRGEANSGAVVFKVEHRHGYTDVPPSGFSLETGNVGFFAPPFNDQGARLTNLYWSQRLNGGRATVTAGFLDATDYVDAFALGSPWLHFSNLAFSTGSAAIGLPGDATLGLAAGALITDNVYAIAGITDANADPTEPFEGFDSFFNENDYFTSLEVGWTSSQQRIIFDNVHATIWHTDGSDTLAVNDGWGIAASASFWIDDQWMPFLRGGFAEDGGTLLETSLSAGLGWQPDPGPNKDLLGAAVNWGKPNSDTFGPGLDDQFSGELFYRLNITETVAITPSVQLVVDPALNPDDDMIGVFGLRGRFAL